MDGVQRIREVLCGDNIYLDKLNDDTGIFEHVDAFVNLSRDNEKVDEICLRLVVDDPDAHRYAKWDKVAEGIGNLQALRTISIVAYYSFDDDEEEDPLAPDWKILACILRRLRLGIQLCMQDEASLLWDTDALPAFAGAIHGQAMISTFSTGNAFTFDCLDILCSALLTLPALENVHFEQPEHDDGDGEGPEEEQSLESMVKLIQSPTLQQVNFECIDFTNTLCQAVAKALKEGSEITDLHFLGCSFPEGGGAVIARALKTNTTLESLVSDEGTDEVFCEVLAAALLSNSTLQYLDCSAPDSAGSCSWLSPLFLALQSNNGLKEFTIRGIHLIDEKMSTAMKLGLRKNSTLETLKLLNIEWIDNDICLWRKALSFLRNNRALKTLAVSFQETMKESHATAIRMEVAAALHENKSLENLSMHYTYTTRTGSKDYLMFVAAMQPYKTLMSQPNTTLKSLRLHTVPFDMDHDETKDLIPILKKNYGLEEFPGLRLGVGDIRSIFDLNRAGRRYLIEDGSSISKGIDVLSRVSNDINSVFLHLLENPRLCDRSAIEMSSSSIGNMDNAGSTSPGNRHSGDKREPQAPSHPGKETRRRLE
jgi:hypothetical protein